jgi:very-short-patch-repair endonuclease
MSNQYENHHYTRYLQPYANKLRKRMTKAEACLWKYVLRASQLNGYAFRRQRPVLNYITDFMCMELMLIIEADGISHQWEGAAERDAVRQKHLEEAGFTVLRFDDREILNNIVGVRECLVDWIEKKKNK